MNTISKNKTTTLTDFFGRPISYVRISVTENCNLRCRYCYDSACGVSKKTTHLSSEQLITLINAFAAIGINKIRFTGGEPTIRKDIIDLVRATSSIDSITQTGLTTNGLLLKKLLPDLIDAGLNRLNISLDTLKRWKFKEITGSDNFEKVYDGIMQALQYKVFRPLKVNTVVMRGINDDEIPRFASWALNYGIDLRFIEFMPTRRSRWGKERFFPESEMKKAMNLSLDQSLNFDNSPGPAKSYSHDGYPGRISFISAVSDNFCGECNRIRLTSHGDLIGCLFSNHKVSILDLLKSNPDQTEIIDFIKNVIQTPGFRRLSHLQSISDSLPLMRSVGG
jgi:molybdenum cofactor biosynthesis protein A